MYLVWSEPKPQKIISVVSALFETKHVLDDKLTKFVKYGLYSNSIRNCYHAFLTHQLILEGLNFINKIKSLAKIFWSNCSYSIHVDLIEIKLR